MPYSLLQVPHGEQGFPGGIKNLPANAGDTGDACSSLCWEDPLEEEMATHSQYSCLENPMDRGAWQATVHRVAESDTSEVLACAHTHRIIYEPM